VCGDIRWGRDHACVGAQGLWLVGEMDQDSSGGLFDAFDRGSGADLEVGGDGVGESPDAAPDLAEFASEDVQLQCEHRVGEVFGGHAPEEFVGARGEVGGRSGGESVGGGSGVEVAQAGEVAQVGRSGSQGGCRGAQDRQAVLPAQGLRGDRSGQRAVVDMLPAAVLAYRGMESAFGGHNVVGQSDLGEQLAHGAVSVGVEDAAVFEVEPVAAFGLDPAADVVVAFEHHG
jgi:hypothetical protein